MSQMDANFAIMSASEIGYDSVLVAKYLIALASEKKRALNITKVQKLLYVAYGLLLADKNRRLVIEHPQAWPFGPVFPRTRTKVDYSVIPDINSEEFVELKEDSDAITCIQAAIDYFSEYSATTLSNWSHEPNSPWDKAVKESKGKWGVSIDDGEIKNYFSKFIVSEN